jgi:hypothetical protein
MSGSKHHPASLQVNMHPTATPDILLPRDDPSPPELSAYVPTESRSFGSMVDSAIATPVEGEVLKKKTVSADFAPVMENGGGGLRGLEVVMVSNMRDVVWVCS